MKYRLQLICHDCEHPGATTCKDGGPPFVTGADGKPLDFSTLDTASSAVAENRGGLTTRVLVENKDTGWEAVALPPKRKSVLD